MILHSKTVHNDDPFHLPYIDLGVYRLSIYKLNGSFQAQRMAQSSNSKKFPLTFNTGKIKVKNIYLLVTRKNVEIIIYW